MSHDFASDKSAGPFARFRRDHLAVRHRIDALERWLDEGTPAADEPVLRAALALLERQFATHMAAEDAVLFPAVREAFPACCETLGQLAADHVELRSMLAVLHRRTPADPPAPVDEQWGIVARDFVDLLRLHVNREESAVFDLATRALPPADLEALAARVDSFLGAADAAEDAPADR